MDISQSLVKKSAEKMDVRHALLESICLFSAVDNYTTAPCTVIIIISL